MVAVVLCPSRFPIVGALGTISSCVAIVLLDPRAPSMLSLGGPLRRCRQLLILSTVRPFLVCAPRPRASLKPMNLLARTGTPVPVRTLGRVLALPGAQLPQQRVRLVNCSLIPRKPLV